MENKKDDLEVNFKDPNIPDREMLRLILFALAKLGREVKFIKEYILSEKLQMTPESKAELFNWCHSQAFAEMEADMLQFIRLDQEKNKKVDLN
jgi:exopolysaccharide biosynthesis predicted pyruvyltransferase EpsI